MRCRILDIQARFETRSRKKGMNFSIYMRKYCIFLFRIHGYEELSLYFFLLIILSIKFLIFIS